MHHRCMQPALGLEVDYAVEGCGCLTCCGLRMRLDERSQLTTGRVVERKWSRRELGQNNGDDFSSPSSEAAIPLRRLSSVDETDLILA